MKALFKNVQLMEFFLWWMMTDKYESEIIFHMI